MKEKERWEYDDGWYELDQNEITPVLEIRMYKYRIIEEIWKLLRLDRVLGLL